MNEPAASPDVAAVLAALRQQAATIPAVHLEGVSIVKQISDQAAEILGTERIQPIVQPVLSALRSGVERVANRVWFADVGTVQRI
ncbi:MAG: hypothetical protein JXA89_25720, partial [Anaerolineae bacterium]|nr:hypothetical protein [Anaerolineae bacterium]